MDLGGKSRWQSHAEWPTAVRCGITSVSTRRYTCVMLACGALQHLLADAGRVPVGGPCARHRRWLNQAHTTRSPLEAMTMRGCGAYGAT